MNLAQCKDKTGCYQAFAKCVGFAPEFLGVYQGPPDSRCETGVCSAKGKVAGSACKEGSDCLSGVCDKHPYAAENSEETICVAPDGAYCVESSAHCKCPDRQSYCGSCYSGGRIPTGAGFSEDGGCYRDCTGDADVCTLGGECSYFSSGDKMWCY